MKKVRKAAVKVVVLVCQPIVLANDSSVRGHMAFLLSVPQSHRSIIYLLLLILNLLSSLSSSITSAVSLAHIDIAVLVLWGIWRSFRMGALCAVHHP